MPNKYSEFVLFPALALDKAGIGYTNTIVMNECLLAYVCMDLGWVETNGIAGRNLWGKERGGGRAGVWMGERLAGCLAGRGIGAQAAQSVCPFLIGRIQLTEPAGGNESER